MNSTFYTQQSTFYNKTGKSVLKDLKEISCVGEVSIKNLINFIQIKKLEKPIKIEINHLKGGN